MSHTPEIPEGRRIVSIYEEFFSGGARILHTDMLVGLQQRGWHNTVLAIHDRTFREETLQFMEQDASYRKLRNAGVEVVSLGRRALNGLDTSPFSADEISIAREAARGTDAVLSLKEHPVRLLNQAQGLGAAAIACLHRSDPENQGQVFNELRIAMETGVIDLATTCAQSSKEAYARAGLPEDAIEVIENGIDLERFIPSKERRQRTRQELGIGMEDPVVALVARFDEMKNIPLFMESAGKFLRDDRSAHVIVCGGGMTGDNGRLGELLDATVAGGDRERLHLLGIRRDMETIYPATDIIALTSHFGEAYPLCLLEGMACGAVPVATKVGDTEQMLQGRGILTSFDSDDIVAAWRDVIAHRDAFALPVAERQKLGRDAMIDNYESVIRSTIDSRAATGSIAV